MASGTDGDGAGGVVGLETDVLVLSVAMFCFSLGFQMTTRYLPRYLSVLGAGALAVGAFGTLQNVLGAAYPYPGGWLADRIGSARALTLFGVASTAGFLVWFATPELGGATPLLPAWGWVFVGLLLAQAWKSLGIGATFALVRQRSPAGGIATGFASTETFRRVAFLVGPLLAAVALAAATDFLEGFRWILAAAVVFAALATVAQHVLYREDRALGSSIEGLSDVIDDLRGLPASLRPLLVADALVRFGNGIVYVFVVLFVTERLAVEATVAGFDLTPDALFGVFLALEMVVALLVMLPAARLADRYGLEPVVALGFGVYAVFPVLLAVAPADPLVVGAIFAVSGIRFAGLPAHKALIVEPAAERAGGRVTGAYYLVRNVVVMPSALLGGVLYGVQPATAFLLGGAVAGAGTVYFVVAGVEP